MLQNQFLETTGKTVLFQQLISIISSRRFFVYKKKFFENFSIFKPSQIIEHKILLTKGSQANITEIANDAVLLIFLIISSKLFYMKNCLLFSEKYN